jgi:acyl-CoA:acyl-CoA alkyltransferase
MAYSRVSIDAIGYELPSHVITTAELEHELSSVYQTLRIPVGQLETMTGIRERRWWPRGQSLAEAAATAGIQTLTQAGFNADDLGAVIYTGVCRDVSEPATACEVAARLGVGPQTIIHDISNACLGVLSGIVDVANRIELGQIRAGLVVSCESARDVNEQALRALAKDPGMSLFRDSLATFTGGSGAVGILLTDGTFAHGRRHLLKNVVTRTAPEHFALCRWGFTLGTDGRYDPFMKTDAVAVLNHGVDLGLMTWRAFREESGWTPDTVDRVICHQVGKMHSQQVLKAFEINPEKDFATFPYLGNMGSVSLPITAAIAAQRGFLQSGQSVGFLGIGSGLNCMMMGVTW